MDKKLVLVPGALPSLISEGGMSRVLWVHISLGNLKQRAGMRVVGREKWGHSSGLLEGDLHDCLLLMGLFCERLCHVSGSMFLQDRYLLKWMPHQSEA